MNLITKKFTSKAVNSTLKKYTLAVLVSALMPLLSQAETFDPVSSSDKLIRIYPAENEEQTNALNVQFNTEKGSYQPNERIRFKVKSNKRVFIYLFNLDPAEGSALLILPNRLQNKHQIKYPGDNRWRFLPNEAMEFYADRSGVERILLVASEKYIDIDKKLQNINNKSVGNFYTMNSALDDLDAVINDAYNSGTSADKLIRVRRSDGPDLPSGIMTKEVNLRIR